MVIWPESLVREIADRRVIIFLGSGISKAAYGNFPTWNELLRGLSSKLTKQKDRLLIGQLIKQGKLLDAAQVVHDGIAKADLNAELRRIFQVRPVPHNDIYNDLLQIDPKIIMTTNYDEFIEKNLEHFSGGVEAHSITDHKSTNLLNDLRSPIRSIIKLHGSVTDPSSLVLDRSSYYLAKRDNSAMFSIVAALMTVNTVLFLGYSISDPDIQITLENVNLHSPSDHPHYALTSKFDHGSIKSALTKTYNLHFLEYPTDAHQMVPTAIRALRDAVLLVRQQRGIV